MADGIARSGFDVDLAFGEARESAFVRAVSGARVECKADRWCRRTGNVAVEIRQGSRDPGKGKLSGISVTEADYWAIEYADDCWLVVRTSLLKVMTRHAADVSGTHMLGDGHRFENVLVPVEWLITPWKSA